MSSTNKMIVVDWGFDCCSRYYYFNLHSKPCRVTNKWKTNFDPYEYNTKRSDSGNSPKEQISMG